MTLQKRYNDDDHKSDFTKLQTIIWGSVGIADLLSIDVEEYT